MLFVAALHRYVRKTAARKHFNLRLKKKFFVVASWRTGRSNNVYHEALEEYLQEATHGLPFMSTPLEQELSVLEDVLNQPERPFALLVGGDRVAQKLRIIRNLVSKVDKILVGGVVACAFTKAQGGAIGDVSIDEEQLGLAVEVLDLARDRGVPMIPTSDVLIVPTKIVQERLEAEQSKPRSPDLTQDQSQTASGYVSHEKRKGAKVDLHASSPTRSGHTTQDFDARLFEQEKEEEEHARALKFSDELAQRAFHLSKKCPRDAIPLEWMPVDLGHNALDEFCSELNECRTVLWIGLLGLCEISDYSEGTKAVMNFLANLTASAGTTTLVCGGHTVSMVDASAYAKCFTRVSRVYDGSLLQMLEGKKPKGDIVRSQSF